MWPSRARSASTEDTPWLDASQHILYYHKQSNLTHANGTLCILCDGSFVITPVRIQKYVRLHNEMSRKRVDHDHVKPLWMGLTIEWKSENLKCETTVWCCQACKLALDYNILLPFFLFSSFNIDFSRWQIVVCYRLLARYIKPAIMCALYWSLIRLTYIISILICWCAAEAFIK